MQRLMYPRPNKKDSKSSLVNNERTTECNHAAPIEVSLFILA